jgi:hypothetical protein
MSRMLMFMHHIALCTPCITLVYCGHPLNMQVDHVKPESQLQAEQVLKEYGGPQVSSVRILALLLDQGKPWCIPPKFLSFIFQTFFIILFDCAISLHDLYGTVVALGFFFLVVLVYPCYNSYRPLEWARHRYRSR